MVLFLLKKGRRVKTETKRNEVAKALGAFVYTLKLCFWEDKAPFDFLKCSNLAVNAMLRKKGHFPGMPIGRKKEIAYPFSPPKGQTNLFGLGYEPTSQELKDYIAKEISLKSSKSKDFQMFPYQRTLNGQFVREGEE